MWYLAMAFIAPIIGLTLLVSTTVMGVAVAMARRNRAAWQIWGMAAGALLGFSAMVYGWGIWTGMFWVFQPTSELCPGKKLDSPSSSESAFPLQYLCRWDDGSTTNLVPGYINPLLIAALVAAAICAGMALWSRRRSRVTTLENVR